MQLALIKAIIFFVVTIDFKINSKLGSNINFWGTQMKTLLSFFVPLVMSLSLMAEHWPTGYYATLDESDQAYYYNDEYRWYCHIQNATQGDLYDVPEQLRIVGDIYSFLSQATGLGECPWPNGFYRIVNTDGPVYRLYPGNICTITSPEMLDAYGGTDSVIESEEGSDYSAHRTDIGQCFWPSYDLN